MSNINTITHIPTISVILTPEKNTTDACVAPELSATATPISNRSIQIIGDGINLNQFINLITYVKHFN